MLTLAAHKWNGRIKVVANNSNGRWMVVMGRGGQWDWASLLTFCRMQKVSWEIIVNMRRETSGNENITSQRDRRSGSRKDG